MFSGPNQRANSAGHGKNALIFMLVTVMISQFVWRADDSLRQKSPVWDEFLHVDYGLNLLLRGPDFEARDHPYPVAALLSLPLLFTLNEKEVASGQPVEMENPRHLLGPRRVNVFLATLFLLLFSLWVYRRFDPMTGLLTLAIGSLDPGWLAQSRFVTTDIALAAGFCMATMAILEHAEKGSARCMVLAAGGLLVALCSKFSGLLLIPSAFLIYALSSRGESREHWLRFAIYRTITLTVLGGTAYLLLFELRGIIAAAPPGQGTKHLLAGFQHFLEVRGQNHGSFLLGTYHPGGSIFYFPVLFLSKTPLALLGICAMIPMLPAARSAVLSTKLLWLAPLLYLSVAIVSHVNLGFRHLTPILPFFWLFCALGVRTLANLAVGGRWKAPLLFAVLLFESCLAHPHYLPFTNAAFGGQEAAHTIAVDSSSDWGQDLPALKSYLNRNPPKDGPLHLAYFGTSDPRKFGIFSLWRPCGQLGWPKSPTSLAASSDAPASLLAISATCFHGAAGGATQDNSYSWLQSKKPESILGGSILIFRDIAP